MPRSVFLLHKYCILTPILLELHFHSAWITPSNDVRIASATMSCLIFQLASNFSLFLFYLLSFHRPLINADLFKLSKTHSSTSETSPIWSAANFLWTIYQLIRLFVKSIQVFKHSSCKRLKNVMSKAQRSLCPAAPKMRLIYLSLAKGQLKISVQLFIPMHHRVKLISFWG